MIFPIRTESDLKKLPYVTMGLIVLNLVIWIFTNRIASPQGAALAQIGFEIAKLEYKYRSAAASDPFLDETNRQYPERYFQRVMQQQDFALWSALREQYKELFQSTVFFRWGFKSSRIEPLKILTAMFLHANFLHVFFNMLFLWIVGCNIEDAWGWKTFSAFYLISGFAAAFLHMLVNAGSNSPCIGASGAVAGVMGAFMIRHFKTKIRFAYYFLPIKPLFGTFSLMAGVWLPIWIVEQLIGAKWSNASGTAYWAHIGGFMFGGVAGLSSRVFDSMKILSPDLSAVTFGLSPEKLMDLNKSLLDGRSDVVIGYLPQIKQVLTGDPHNITARLVLAKLYLEKGRLRDAAGMYNAAVFILFKKNALDGIRPLVQEIREKNLIELLSENNLIRLGSYFEKAADFREAVQFYMTFINTYPNHPIRPKALHRVAIILRTRLNDETAAEKVLTHLQKLYPSYTSPNQLVGA